jgi:DNA-binding transcriptional ArsR family regulator
MKSPPKRALSHPKRLAIFEYLTQKGTAIEEAELVEALDLAVPVARYHLTVLCDADLIVQIEDDGQGRADSFIAADAAG